MTKTKKSNVQARVGNITCTQQFNAAETANLREGWRAAFAKEAIGVGLSQYLWHTFSADCYPAESGAAAEAAYRSHEATEYVVLPNDKSLAFMSSSKPVREWFDDFYVFPRNFAWTMAYTHEDGWLGPYFARHPNYDALQVENSQYLKKQRDIAIAKSKGWA
jgi:hypothetical protein